MEITFFLMGIFASVSLLNLLILTVIGNFCYRLGQQVARQNSVLNRMVAAFESVDDEPEKPATPPGQPLRPA